MVSAVQRSSIVLAAAIIIALPWPAAAVGQDPAMPHLTVDDGVVAQLLREREASSTRAVAASTRPLNAPGSRHRIQQAILASLYATHVALQAVDIRTTTRGLRRGAAEANPLLRRIAGYPAALATIKTGANAAVVLIAEKMWKRNRVAAVVFMAAVNSVMACVVRHNHKVLREDRRPVEHQPD